jgi:hypothetical protein
MELDGFVIMFWFVFLQDGVTSGEAVRGRAHDREKVEKGQDDHGANGHTGAEAVTRYRIGLGGGRGGEQFFIFFIGVFFTFFGNSLV